MKLMKTLLTAAALAAMLGGSAYAKTLVYCSEASPANFDPGTTTGGNTDDLKESLRLTEAGKINPAVMVTHIGGLNVAAETSLHLPQIPGDKKLIYTHIDMPLTAIADFASLGKSDSRFAALAEITEAHRGLWCPEAEEYLLENWN